MKALLCLLLLISLAHASLRDNCLSLLEAFQKSPFDSAVELELPISEEVMQILTTQNGKLDSLLEKRQIDETFKYILKQKFENKSLQEISWDDLSLNEKIYAIELAHKHLSIDDFFYNRKIRGIKIKDWIEVEFNESIRIENLIYPKGKHRLRASRWFFQVEFKSPGDIKKFSGVELHFRTKGHVGDVGENAWKILDAIKVPRPHQHVHMVAKIPLKEIQGKPKYYPAVIVDFNRRANLFAEMYSIIFEYSVLKNSSIGHIDFFGSLKPHYLTLIYDYFRQFRHPSFIRSGLENKTKISYVALRGHDKYDEELLWGLEFRSIAKDSHAENLKVTLNNLQQMMLQKDFGVTVEELKSWHQTMGAEKELGNLLATQWYKQADVPQVNSHLTSFAPKAQELAEKYFSNLIKITQERNFLHYVFHYWGNDPLFYNQPQKLNRLKSAQMQALAKLENEYPEIARLTDQFPRLALHRLHDIVKEFLIDSGLYEEVAKSLKIKHAP